MEPLKVCAIQANLVWEKPEENLKNFEDKILGLENKPDVIVLPEMFSSGFTMNVNEMAEDMDGPSFNKMKKWAAKTEAAVTGSLIIKVGDNYFNRLIWMQPDGNFKYYDKRHLFTLAGEHKHFTPGSRNITVEWKGWRIRPLICYDLRFPVWSRNSEDYDLLIYVANWPERRCFAWDSLLVARAIENQAYVVGVNRVGHDGKQVYFTGNTAIIDPMGETLSNFPLEEEHIETVSLSARTLKEIRQKLAFLNDRDEYMIL